MNVKTTIAAMTLSALACAITTTPANADSTANPSAQNRATATKGSPASGESSDMGKGGHMGMHDKMGAHSMKGTVEDLDTQTGALTLKTAEGDLKLHFPPKALAKVKKGEELQVHLSFSPVK